MEKAQVVSATPGRVRLKFPSEKMGVPDIDALLDIDKVERVTFNKITKSLLIIYDNKLSLKKLLSEIENNIPEIKIVKEKPDNKIQIFPNINPKQIISSVVKKFPVINPPENKPKSSNGLQIVRRFDGGLRLKSDQLKDLADVRCNEFVEKTMSTSGTESVKINPLLGTALIRYNPNQIDEKIILRKIIRKYGKKTTHIPILPKHAQFNRTIKIIRYEDQVTTWETMHELPGRLRLRQPLIYQRTECCHRLEKTLFNTPGVEKFRADSVTATVLITYDGTKVSKTQLINLLHITLEETPADEWKPIEPKLSRLALSSSIMGLGAATCAFPVLAPVTTVLVCYTMMPIVEKAGKALLQKKIKVDILDTAVIICCLVTGNVFAAALMVWVLDVADKILYMTSEQSRKLLDQAFGKQVRFAWLLKDGQEIQVPVEKLRKNDIIAISPSELIPVDGIVRRGDGMVDQHILTGESAPVEKKSGDKVLASTTVLAGKIYVKVEDVGENTVEAKVRKIIVESANYKPKLQSTGEQIADKMVLPTLVLGALGFGISGPSAALGILNADYGTGIRVAAPTAVLASLANAARNGIVVKKGSALETLPKIDTFLFDKTGTLTHETPEVSEIIGANGYNKEEILTYAATAEQRFSHPIANAIMKKAKELKLKIMKKDESEYNVGFGVRVKVNGDTVKVGSTRFMNMENIPIPEHILKRVKNTQKQGRSAILVAVNDTLAGAIELRSSHRPEAYDIIQGLKKKGIETVLISGDNEGATRDIAKRLEIDQYYANVLPQHKAEYVKMLQKNGNKVGMVGDGINDGAALSLADVSVSLRGASDVATDVADIIFMDGDLTKFDTLYDISDKLKKNIDRSFWLIVVPNTACILGALSGVTGLGASLVLNNMFNFLATFNGALLYNAKYEGGLQ